METIIITCPPRCHEDLQLVSRIVTQFPCKCEVYFHIELQLQAAGSHGMRLETSANCKLQVHMVCVLKPLPRSGIPINHVNLQLAVVTRSQ